MNDYDNTQRLIAAIERTDALVEFVDKYRREHGRAPTYSQIASHMTRRTGRPHTRNTVAGLMHRRARREAAA